ncbi:uncharacterized protein LOC117114442 isoform X2 [Anneissia japonica]|uniref:uncharacterized protein LOC117114442 isoform X2 n=1 Tax=Anneissia japonica TaxID=1529436 RepID=UPI00142590EF|nr:uncharacterized protein LOC117114442 isoform X2 [Anneissia japonica]
MWFRKTLLFLTLTAYSLLIQGDTRVRHTRKRHREYNKDSFIRSQCQFCNLQSLEETPVCGTNGNTYYSACLLKVTACMEADPTLQIRHRGRCRSRLRNYELGLLEEGSSELINEHASDSRQFERKTSKYGNRSDIADEREVLEDEEFLAITSPATTSSPFDKDMNDPGNMCPNYCSLADLDEVCGSDGLTYVSACFLELAACQPGQSDLRLAYRGHCKRNVLPTSQSEGVTQVPALGDAIVAEHSQECCPLDLYDPVCARLDTQEITFRSMCEIECMYMRQSLNIEIIKQGNCDDRFALQGLQSYPLTCGNTIDYDINDVTSYAMYISQLMQMYDEYTPTKQKRLYKNCAEGSTARKQFGRLCKFKQRQFGSWCTPANMFGFASGQPCIMLQLTKVSNWVPINYKNTPKKLSAVHRPNYISVTCNEIIDRKKRVNTTKIFPKNGFGFHHFPYRGMERWPYQRQYLSPAVLVRIIPRKLNANFRIKCRAWAKNIDYKTGIYADFYQAQAIIAFSITDNNLQYRMSRL